MKITLRYFAQLKERLGKEAEILDLPEESSVEMVFVFVFPDSKERKQMETYLRVAVNQEYSRMETQLKEGDEVAFIPPVAGG